MVMIQGVIFLITIASLAEANGGVAAPCCQSCAAGKEKFYSIPNPGEANPQCGECCLDPSRYDFWKMFEPKLLKGDCAVKGFTKYIGTETDGVWPLSVTNDRYARGNASGTSATPALTTKTTDSKEIMSVCPDGLRATYADMHDGDEKALVINGKMMKITPAKNNQSWVVYSELDVESCSAVVNFDVPGKPSPPPVKLLATFWNSVSVSQAGVASAEKTELEFTDPSGTLAAKDYPLNRWVGLGSMMFKKPVTCPASFRAVYADMHDGDKKEVMISGKDITVKPSGNDQTWVVRSRFDAVSCSAIIDFNVPGKPSPPPFNLKATLVYTFSENDKKTEFEFTKDGDSKNLPLNSWVQISTSSTSNEILV